MSTKLRICNGEPWFLKQGSRGDGPGYDPCYSLVITYALFHYWQRGHNIDESRNVLNSFLQAVAGQHEFIDSNFMSLFPFMDGNGCAIIDESRGCYPLVLYSDKVKRQNKKGRVGPFRDSIADIIRYLDKLENLYQRIKFSFPDSWDENVQQKILQEIIPFHSKKC